MSGVLTKELRLKRRQEIKKLYEEGKSVAAIAKMVDLTRYAVYQDLDRLREAGEVEESKTTTTLSRMRQKAAEAVIEEGMTDEEIALANNIKLYQAVKYRQLRGIRATKLVNIQYRQAAFLKFYDHTFKPGKNFATYFKDVMPPTLYGYYVRGEEQDDKMRNKRGFQRRSFELGDVEELIRKEVIEIDE